MSTPFFVGVIWMATLVAGVLLMRQASNNPIGPVLVLVALGLAVWGTAVLPAAH